MRKIPTLFVRDLTTHLVIDERVPGTEWVGDPTVPQIATRKYDGSCMRYDADGTWWARREVKAGQSWPEYFLLEEEDQITHKTVGWVPAHASSYGKQWADVIIRMEHEGHRISKPATYELVGPSINRNPDGFDRDELVEHGQHMYFDTPTDFEALRNYLEYFTGEGIVWWAQDGRRAKIKRRDFGWSWGGGR